MTGEILVAVIMGPLMTLIMIGVAGVGALLLRDVFRASGRDSEGLK